MTVTGVEGTLFELLVVFRLAVAEGVAVAKVGRFPYTIALVLAGLTASVTGVDGYLELSHDLILLVPLPPLLFEGVERDRTRTESRLGRLVTTLARSPGADRPSSVVISD